MTSTVKNSVSIVIVIHNSQQVLTGCLESLRKTVTGLDFELIVVDNNSDDNPIEIINTIKKLEDEKEENLNKLEELLK